MPDGAWFAEAPPGAARFVIVSLVSSAEAPMFGGPAYKDAVYGQARADDQRGRCRTGVRAHPTLLTDADLT